MRKILIQFAHPLLEKSRVQAALLKSAKTVEGVFINDLYQRYPDFDIDIDKEKTLLLSHDIIIWQHPLYWYSCPPLLKQWLDLVLEHGWAYGKMGTALKGKKVFTVISSGGSQQAYQTGGYNKYTIHDYLRPFERTAELCGMVYWPPFWVHSVHHMRTDEITEYGLQYKNLLTALAADIYSEEDINNQSFMNDLLPHTSTNV